jgi:4-hydroxy-2-oxoheptanedioate aldolase
MSPSLNPFKARLQVRHSPPQLGTWLVSAAPSTAEALGFCGFDFLVVDMEHTPIGVADAANILRAIAGTPAQPLVRLAWNDRVLVKRVLDAGARTLMFPFIQSVEEAQAAVSYTRYPPNGVRGVASVHRASRFGRVPGYLKSAGDDIAVIAQLETPEAIGLLPEIAAVNGIDAVFVGPGDLSASMGHIGELEHPDVQDLIKEAASMALDVDKPIGIVGPSPDVVRKFLGYGYTFAAVSSDIAMMTGRAVEWRAALGGSAAPNHPSAAY